MKKANKIIYWIATIWLALGMTSTGIVQLLNITEEVQFIINLGYPRYLLAFLGVAKILAVITLLVPGYPLMKEWAYAGLFFMMAAAVYSHIAAGNAISEIFPSLLLLTLTVISWLFRPMNRRIITPAQSSAKHATGSLAV